MSHEVSHETLTRWLDDELPPDERERVEDHLSRCTECRREAEIMNRMKEDLAELPGGDAARGETVWDGVNRRLTRPLGWILLVAGALGAVALGVADFLGGSGTSLWEKLATGAVVGGLGLLLASVGWERWKEWKTDPYRKVER